MIHTAVLFLQYSCAFLIPHQVFRQAGYPQRPEIPSGSWGQGPNLAQSQDKFLNTQEATLIISHEENKDKAQVG